MNRNKFEAKVADNAKCKPKMLSTFVNTRLKSRTQIEDLPREDVSFARTSLEKAEELNKFLPLYLLMKISYKYQNLKTGQTKCRSPW